MDCSNCQLNHTCCKDFGVTLSKDEVNSKFFHGKFKVTELTENGKLIGYVLVLRKKTNGSCIYLNDETELCDIYENRPNACRNFNCDERIG